MCIKGRWSSWTSVWTVLEWGSTRVCIRTSVILYERFGWRY